MTHCWKDRAEDARERFGDWSPQHCEAFLNNGSCMRPDGHAGPHEFVSDSEIAITFEPEEAP